MTYLPDEHHLGRFVSNGKIVRDNTDKAIRFIPQAFELRANEEYLSSSWLEFFSGDKTQQVVKTIQAMKDGGLTIKKGSAVGVYNVGKFKSACEKYGSKVRIIHEPEPNNPAYTAIRNYPRDVQELFSLLAETAEIFETAA